MAYHSTASLHQLLCKGANMSHRGSATAGKARITGVVQSAEGRIRLKVRGLRGREQEVEAVIDTGYTASLTLPPAVVAALGLHWWSTDRFTLADGREHLFNVYVAR